MSDALSPTSRGGSLSMITDPDAVAEALARPFAPEEVQFKPGAVSGNRALAMGYVDARTIQDRLDEVLGVGGWQDEYEALPDGSVVCRLRLRLGSEWITKMDVGSPSEQPDEGDRRKAAFSDALKRTAVKFGIGRYLYRLPVQWVDFDPKKRRFTATPTLPPEALPARAGPKKAAGKKAEPAPAPDGDGDGKPLPTGPEFERRLRDYDAKLAREGLILQDDLVESVAKAGAKAGYPLDLAKWDQAAVRRAADFVLAFEDKMRKKAAKQRQAKPAAAREPGQEG